MSWTQVPGVAICGRETRLELRPGDADGVLLVDVVERGRLVLTRSYSVDHLIDKILGRPK